MPRRDEYGQCGFHLVTAVEDRYSSLNVPVMQAYDNLFGESK
jgi:hypothetical protein